MKLRRRDSITGFLFTAPAIIGVLVFFAIPFFVSIRYTFTFGVGGGDFVGFNNYIEVFNSQAFRLAAYNTGRFILVGVPLIMLISLALSLMLQKQFASASFFRSVFLYPLVVPVASVVMVVQVLFEEKGLINSLLDSLHLPVVSWLHSEWAFPVLILLYIWKNCGYNIVLLLSGLNSIPKDFYEAARVDGATSWQQMRYITLPMLIPSFFFVFVISIVNSFKSFREAFLIGGSMPTQSIYMLQHFMNNNFQNLNYQRLSIAALIVFLVIFIFIFLLYRLRNKAGDMEI